MTLRILEKNTIILLGYINHIKISDKEAVIQILNANRGSGQLRDIMV